MTRAALRAPVGFAARKATSGSGDERKTILELMPGALRNNDPFRTILFLPDAWTRLGFKLAPRLLRVWLHGSTERLPGFVQIDELTRRAVIHDFFMVDLQADEMRSMPELSHFLRDRVFSDGVTELAAATKKAEFVRKVSEAARANDVLARLKKKASVVLGNFATPTDPAGSAFHYASFAYNGLLDTFVSPGIRNYKGESTDFDCAINRFRIDAYAKCRVMQMSEKLLSLQFNQVGYRFVDSYDFNDSIVSQRLGKWKVPEEERFVSLSNRDFREFRAEFMPMYNAIAHEQRATVASLACVDFHLVSAFMAGNQIPEKDRPTISVALD